MNSAPLPLSIVVPVFEAGPYLQTLFASIDAQRQGGYELLLLDDGSTDSSLAQCRAYARDRPHVTVVEQGHRGVSHTRNNGIARAAGEYLLFLDADDWIEPYTVAELLALIAARPVDVIIGQVAAFREPGTLRSYHEEDFSPAGVDGRTAGEVGLYLQSTGASVAIPVRYIVRRAMVLQHRLQYPDTLFEDEIWSASVIVNAASFLLYPRYFYRYRLRAGSRSTTQCAEVLVHYMRLVELLMALMQGRADPQVIQFLEMRCQHLLNKITCSPYLDQPDCADARAFLLREDIRGIAARNAELVPRSYRA